ncbi:MAG: SGNH/GDSL hydrolase family protein [Candidatus Omnitrophota bacterium]
MMKQRSLLIFRIFILVSALIFLSLLGELFVRLNPRLYCQGYRPSKNDRVVYELYPGYIAPILKTKINSQGLNDRYFPIHKPLGTYRIAVVGDSTSFGWGVGGENSFPKILERLLNERRANKFEVINFSVPGYNTSQEFEVIKEKVIKFNPDMVILIYCENDTHICNYIKSDITPLKYLYNKSYFFHTFFRGVDILINKQTSNKSIRKYWLTFKKKILGMYYHEQLIYPYPGLEEVTYVKWNPPNTMEEVPKKYYYMLGYDNYRIHVSHIYNFLKRKRVEFISSGILGKDALTINQDLAIKNVCNLADVIEAKEHLYNDTNFPAYGHFNLSGHNIAAEYLYNFIEKQNLI